MILLLLTIWTIVLLGWNLALARTQWRFFRRFLKKRNLRIGNLPALIGNLPVLLDWFLKITERLLVFGVVFVIVYLAGHVLFGTAAQPTAQQPANKALAPKDALDKFGEHWQVLFLLLIPLLYRTVNKFLEEAHDLFGAKRPPKAYEITSDEEKEPTRPRTHNSEEERQP